MGREMEVKSRVAVAPVSPVGVAGVVAGRSEPGTMGKSSGR